jgi:hypothetical protein
MKRNRLVSAILLFLLVSIVTTYAVPAFPQDSWLSKLDGARFWHDYDDGRGNNSQWFFTIRGHHVVETYTFNRRPPVYGSNVYAIQGNEFETLQGDKGIISEDGSHILLRVKSNHKEFVYARE